MQVTHSAILIENCRQPLLSSGLVCPTGRLTGVPDTTTEEALPWYPTGKWTLKFCFDPWEKVDKELADRRTEPILSKLTRCSEVNNTQSTFSTSNLLKVTHAKLNGWLLNKQNKYGHSRCKIHYRNNLLIWPPWLQCLSLSRARPLRTLPFPGHMVFTCKMQILVYISNESINQSTNIINMSSLLAGHKRPTNWEYPQANLQMDSKIIIIL